MCIDHIVPAFIAEYKLRVHDYTVEQPIRAKLLTHFSFYSSVAPE
jgi:hypothetical protein